MYKHKLLPVIAAIMITSIAVSLLSFSTTTVSATGSSASISPEKAGASRWVILTLTVDSDPDDNIARIVLVQSSWDDPMGGENSTFSVAENWENAEENMKKAKTEMSYVVENLRIAAENKKATKSYFENFGREIYEAGTDLGLLTGGAGATVSYTYVRDRLQESKVYFEKVGAALGTEPESLMGAAENLKQAGIRIRQAGENMEGENEEEYPYRENAATLLKTASGQIENAGENYLGWNFGTVASLLSDAATNIKLAAENLKISTPTAAQDAGADLDEADDFLSGAATRLAAAGDRLNDAGTKLSTIANTYLDNAVSIAINVTGTTRTYLSAYFSENIDEAGAALSTSDAENILSAGTNLSEAGLALNAVTDLDRAMLDFGARYLTLRSDSVDNLLVRAGDNLSTASTVDLTTAASLLENAASQLGEAAAVLSATAGKLKPSNWELSEPKAGQVQFKAENEDYYIAPGAPAKEFVFLWASPAASGTYKFTLYAYDDTDDQEFVLTEFDSIEIDATVPGLVLLQVTQAGVTENNLAKADNAKLTIKASEALSDLGAVTIENEDIFVGPLSMADLTTTDNITFEYTFSVGTWDENSPVDIKIAAPWATDEYGNENISSATAEFYVDTRAPILLENGLQGLLNAMVGQKAQAGTGYLYWVDNNADQTIQGNVEDNWTAGTRLGYENYDDKVVSVTIEWDTNSVAADPMLEPDNGFTKTFDLSEGLNSVVKVTATDWTGNTVSDNVENIFIDTQAPTIEFNTITKAGAAVSWTSGILTNDNSPEIKLTALDPDYPTKGLGVARENLIVMLSHKSLAAANPDNFFALYAETDNRIVLENKAAWDPSTGVFENLADNAGKGLLDRTYYIHVWASDNLFHGIEYGKVASRSFTIDTVKPKTDDIGFSVDYTATTPAVPHPQKITTLAIGGTVEELDGVIKVYVAGVLAYTSDALTSLDWTASVTLTAGTTQRVQVTYTDVAGNESDKKQYGYFLADGSAPTVTISSPVTGASTDKTSIQITGYVTKNDWEDFADFAGKVKIQVGGASPGDVTLVQDPTDSNKGNFTSSATLGEGTNVITITAKDAVGNVGSGSVSVERTVAPLTTYAIIIVVVALILAAIAIFVKK